MSDVAISVEGISKKYLIGHQVATSLSDRVRSLIGKKMIGSEEEFWALKDVSFEIKKGEAIGIIGKNGAGKSTLLKILSRITYPTTGRFEMNGRVSSLLEVGTGFHPELSGRENIFLNGTILGMSRREVKEKFDEIVDFSGVSKFLDTPVKHYSSGMYVRLAFAVAAHLEPEILIIDEVLAVGDAEFQKKCIGKMDEVAKQGRTVIFVSHNMSAVENLCTRGILIDSGYIKSIDNIHDTVNQYLNLEKVSNTTCDLHNLKERAGDGLAKFNSYKLFNSEGSELKSGTAGQFLKIRLNILINDSLVGCRISIAIISKGKPLFLLASENTLNENLNLNQNCNIDFDIDRLPLDVGKYDCTLYFASSFGIHDSINEAFELEVSRGSFFKSGKNSPKGWEGSVTLVDHKCIVYEE
jgi:lipopolysaccharide transport system ATP-binding protein